MSIFSSLLPLVSFLIACCVGATAAPLLRWTESPGLRFRELHPDPNGKAGFTQIPSGVSGVAFTNALQGDQFLTNAVAHNGSGLAIGDVDGDDWPDLYFCNLQGPNRLYRNLGDFRFSEIEPGPAACANQLSTGSAFADVDGDRDLDLLVNGIATGTRLFLNNGRGGWTEMTNSGLSRTNSPTSLALADIDGDGDLDLYCPHYIDVMHLADPTTRFAMARRDGKWEVVRINGESTRSPRWKNRFETLPDGSVRELPEVHGFYRNLGQGRFIPIQNEPGLFSNHEGSPIPPFRDWGLAAMFRDINGDLAPDLYVCNDNASPDRFWINTGSGTFRAINPINLRHTSRSSMGLDFADVNRDGHDDLFVLDMFARDHRKRMTQLVRDYPDSNSRERIEDQPRFNRNALFRGRADGSFAEVAFMAGVAATDWSWCPIFLDVDLDGYEDLLVSNGFSFDVMDQDSHNHLRQTRMPEAELKRARRLHPAWPTANVLLKNRGNGEFQSMAREWGFDQIGISNGMALGDLDRDGDLDVVINNLNAAPSLLRNDAPAPRLAVRLKGVSPNTQGTGAKLKLLGGPVPQSQEMICGGRYMSGDQALRVFAANIKAGGSLVLEITWRNGKQSRLLSVQPNRLYEIDEASAKPRETAPAPSAPQPYFVDRSSWLGHNHVENVFDDWRRQPLIPRRFSRLGPGLSWHDLNGDGWEDLLLPGAFGSKTVLFLNQTGQGFQRIESSVTNRTDQSAALGWSDGTGPPSLIAANTNAELGPNQESQLARFRLESLSSGSVLQLAGEQAAGKEALGPLTLGDIDRDGDLDLFVGGRGLTGRYPEPVSSSIWFNENGALRMDAVASRPFQNLGLVSGATLADFDGDGQLDLAVSLEWGPLRLFRNEGGTFTDKTTAYGFAEFPGWWTSVTAGDYDGDGRLDLAAGNWGLNTSYELYRPGPLRVYYGDWNQDGVLELLEAWNSGGAWLPIRERLWFDRGFPEMMQKFPAHAAYAMATVEEILGARKDQTRILEVACLESSIFLNRGDRFERLPLPTEAQITPAFSVNTADFDGDGIEDLFLSQNFFGAASDFSREDSGLGLWLKGEGNGRFKASDADLSGIKIYGEQRGAALADFNHDGRVDLAVSQNNAATKLYVNQQAKRGFRVTLRGPKSNPDAVGAQMRVLYDDGHSGPQRPIQAGSGYWSQDAAVQVLGLAGKPKALAIRWPGGKEQIVSLNAQTWDVQIALDHAP